MEEEPSSSDFFYFVTAEDCVMEASDDGKSTSADVRHVDSDENNMPELNEDVHQDVVEQSDAIESVTLEDDHESNRSHKSESSFSVISTSENDSVEKNVCDGSVSNTDDNTINEKEDNEFSRNLDHMFKYAFDDSFREAPDYAGYQMGFYDANFYRESHMLPASSESWGKSTVRRRSTSTQAAVNGSDTEKTPLRHHNSNPDIQSATKSPVIIRRNSRRRNINSSIQVAIPGKRPMVSRPCNADSEQPYRWGSGYYGNYGQAAQRENSRQKHFTGFDDELHAIQQLAYYAIQLLLLIMVAGLLMMYLFPKDEPELPSTTELLQKIKNVTHICLGVQHLKALQTGDKSLLHLQVCDDDNYKQEIVNYANAEVLSYLQTISAENNSPEELNVIIHQLAHFELLQVTSQFAETTHGNFEQKPENHEDNSVQKDEFVEEVSEDLIIAKVQAYLDSGACFGEMHELLTPFDENIVEALLAAGKIHLPGESHKKTPQNIIEDQISWDDIVNRSELLILQEKVDQLLKQNEKFQKDISQCSLTTQDLQQDIHRIWSVGLQQYVNHDDSIQLLQGKIKELFQENQDLQNNIANYSHLAHELQNQTEQLFEDNESLHKSINQNSHSSNKLHQKVKNLFKENDLLTDIIKSLERNMVDLQHLLTQQIAETAKWNKIIEHFNKSGAFKNFEKDWSWDDLKIGVSNIVLGAQKDFSEKFGNFSAKETLQDYAESNKKAAEYILNSAYHYFQAAKDQTTKILEEGIGNDSTMEGFWNIVGGLQEKWQYVQDKVNKMTDDTNTKDRKAPEDKIDGEEDYNYHKTEDYSTEDYNPEDTPDGNWYFRYRRRGKFVHNEKYFYRKQKNWMFHRAAGRERQRKISKKPRPCHSY